MSNKKGFNMTHAFSAKDVDLVNASIREEFVNNSRIMSFNAIIHQRIVNSNNALSASIKKYAELLECIDFSRLIKLAEFYTMDISQHDQFNQSNFFSLWHSHNFWIDKEVGSCLKTARAIDRERLQEEMLRDLKSVMIESECRLDLKSGMLFYRDYDENQNKVIRVLQGFDATSFELFLHEILSPILRLKDVQYIVKNIIPYIVGHSISNSIIQFLDCYIEEGEIYEGFSSEAPRFIILRKVYDAVKSKKVTKKIKEVDQLIEHLCDYDQMTVNRVVAVLSTVFLNASVYKSKFTPSLRFYGPSGANGKTVFGDLLSRAFNSSNVSDLNLSNLDDQHQLESVLSSLIAIDDDSSNVKLSNRATEYFKKIVTGKDIQSREIYQSARKIDARCLIILFSNNLPLSSDKTDGFFRRVNIVRCSRRLKESKKFNINDKFYERLHSEEAAQYIVEKLLIESQKLKKLDELPEMSSSMQIIHASYQDENDSARLFVETVGIDQIVGHHVVDVRQSYERWCEENDLTPLKKQFNDVLKTRYDLEARSVKSRFIADDARRAKSAVTNSAERCWQFADKSKNEEYFESLNKETQS